jgi:hypothetical protein
MRMPRLSSFCATIGFSISASNARLAPGGIMKKERRPSSFACRTMSTASSTWPRLM